MKAGIPILSFLFLALVFSCKSVAQSAGRNVVPEPELPIVQIQNPEETAVFPAEIVDISGIVEEVPPVPEIDAEVGISELTAEAEPLSFEDTETAAEIWQPESIEMAEAEEVPEELEEEAETEELPESAENKNAPETPVQEESQAPPVQVTLTIEEEESTPLPVEVPTPTVEQPPVVQQPPPPVLPAQPPPVPETPPVSPAPPPVQQPPAQQPPPERTAPREPPSPPPFLGPAEPERPPPVRQETFTSEVPELPGLQRDETPETQVVFSRVVRLTVGQILEIPFRGTGWVYLGELGNRRGVSYDSRRLDVENRITIGQSFIFRAEIPGTYILKFYKQDFIQDYIINDYVQVIVGETDDSGTGRAFSNIDRGRVVAEPRWPFVPEAAGSASETTSLPAMPQAPQAAGAAAETTSQRPNEAVTQADTAEQSFAPAAASPAAESVLSPEEYVRQAKQEFDAGRVEQALAVLEQMKQRYPYGTDEAWWLLGQLYEANSPARDIRLSLEYYRRLVNEYPQSDRVADARRRIAYLERYYLNIR